jgi:hypothetical protein
VGGKKGGREREWRGKGGEISKGVICSWFGVRVLEECCLQPDQSTGHKQRKQGRGGREETDRQTDREEDRERQKERNRDEKTWFKGQGGGFS